MSVFKQPRANTQGLEPIQGAGVRPARDNRLLLIGVAALWISALSGCLNNGSGVVKKSGLANGSSGVLFSGPDGTALFSVLSSRTSPGSSANIDLFGDGSGGIGKNCGEPSGSNNGSDSPLCSCVYTYTFGNGNVRKEYDAIYTEEDMIRCPFSDLQSGATDIAVRIGRKADGKLTGALNLSSTGGTTPVVTNDIGGFVQVKRYMCREIFSTSNLTEPSIYDPIQSADTKNALSYNFYSTNLFSSYNFYTRFRSEDFVIRNFDCPTFTNDNITQSWMDLDIFSLANAGAFSTKVPGSNVREVDTFKIFDSSAKASNNADDPATPTVNPDKNPHSARSMFYLAKQSSSLFNVPVNAFVAPQILSQTTPNNSAGLAAMPPTMGFATHASGNGCPSVAAGTLPTNMRFAKLWLFKLKYQRKTIITKGSGDNADSITDQMGNLFCNVKNAGFHGCTDSTAIDGKGAAPLSSRFSDRGQTCFSVSPQAGKVTHTPHEIANASLPLTDRWTPDGGSCVRDAESIAGFNSNSTSQGFMYTNACTNDATKELDNTPFTSTRLQDYVKTSDELADFIFVVSPPEIGITQMQDRVGQAASYTPYRFLDPSKCTNRDINHLNDPNDLECGPNSKNRLNYILQTSAINDPSAAPLFPLCVVQPDDTAGTAGEGFYADRSRLTLE